MVPVFVQGSNAIEPVDIAKTMPLKYTFKYFTYDDTDPSNPHESSVVKKSMYHKNCYILE